MLASGAHSDWAHITFLVHDGTPGLQVLYEGEWASGQLRRRRPSPRAPCTASPLQPPCCNLSPRNCKPTCCNSQLARLAIQ
jgi:hypothetical protein